jgi:hypothetical protein
MYSEGNREEGEGGVDADGHEFGVASSRHASELFRDLRMGQNPIKIM